MDIGGAIEALRAGNKVRRRAWKAVDFVTLEQSTRGPWLQAWFCRDQQTISIQLLLVDLLAVDWEVVP